MTRSVRVVGVAPASLDYPLGADLWMPLTTFYGPFSLSTFDADSPTFRQFHGMGRLRAGVSVAEAQAEIGVIFKQSLAQFPNLPATQIEMAPLLDAMLGNAQRILWFLFAAAGLVFVIAGVNVSALLLMRASARSREVAVRLALGASRARLMRQTVIESLLIGVIGAVGGVVLAQASLALVQWLGPGELPRIDQAAIDLRVLIFTLVASLVWVVTFGTAPSWRRTRAVTLGLTPELVLRGVGGTAALRVFTIAEVAAAVVVAIAAGLLVRSLMQLQGINRGYDSGNMAVFRLLLPDARYQTARERLTFFERLVPERRVDSRRDVGVARTPWPGYRRGGLECAHDFRGPDARRSRPQSVGDLGTRHARLFSDARGSDSQRTRRHAARTAPTRRASRSSARQWANGYWPGQNPIGKRLKLTRDMDWTTVVGVAADTRYRELTRSWMTVYFPAPQFFFFNPGSLVVRTTGRPGNTRPSDPANDSQLKSPAGHRVGGVDGRTGGARAFPTSNRADGGERVRADGHRPRCRWRVRRAVV